MQLFSGGGKRHNITTGLGIAHKGIMDCSSSGQSSPIPPLLEDLTIGVPVERDRSYSLSPVISRGYASVADASVEQERYGAPSAGFLSSMFRRHLSSKSSLDMHKNFSRDRIESLRSQFRPAVLETYLAASVAREEWLRSQESEAAEVD